MYIKVGTFFEMQCRNICWMQGFLPGCVQVWAVWTPSASKFSDGLSVFAELFVDDENTNIEIDKHHFVIYSCVCMCVEIWWAEGISRSGICHKACISEAKGWPDSIAVM